MEGQRQQGFNKFRGIAIGGVQTFGETRYRGRLLTRDEAGSEIRSTHSLSDDCRTPHLFPIFPCTAS